MSLLGPHELRKLLKRYGVEVEEVKGVERVELYTSDKKIVVYNPQVVTLKYGGQFIYQVVGREVREEPITTTPLVAPEKPTAETVPVSEDDIKFVMEYTGVSYEKAKQALIKARGDIAKAIMIIAEGDTQ